MHRIRKIPLKTVRKKTQNFLTKIGFSTFESQEIVNNILYAELSEKKSHGLLRLPWLRSLVEKQEIHLNKAPMHFEENTFSTINCERRTGYTVMSQLIKHISNQTEERKVILFSLNNLAPSMGVVGDYTRKLCDLGWISVIISNTQAVIRPPKANLPLWGTNPLAIGIPRQNNQHIVLDMACSKISWGEILRKSINEEPLEELTALDKHGKQTLNAASALEGTLLPFDLIKGSGLAFIIELLSSALTGAKVGNEDNLNLGCLVLLLKPELCTTTTQFNISVEKLVGQLKESGELYYPGESSYLKFVNNLQSKYIKLEESIYLYLLKNGISFD